MQWKNGWAGDYRTRAQLFSHCAIRTPKGFDRSAIPGNISHSVSRQKEERAAFPAPSTTLPSIYQARQYHNTTCPITMQSKISLHSFCTPGRHADLATSINPSKTSTSQPSLDHAKSTTQSLRNLKSWRNYSAILKSPRIRRTVGPEYIEPEEHPEATSGTAAPTLTTQGWYTTRSQGHSITNVSDHSRAVHHSIPFPISRQSKTPAQQTPTAIQNTTVPTQS